MTNILYGLLDVDQNFFYVVDTTKSIIDRLCTIIGVDKKIAVIELHACSNWVANQIDNEICQHWGIGFLDKAYRQTSLMGNDLILVNHQRPLNEKAKIIIKNLNYIKKILFEIDANSPAFEYRAPKNISIMFADDPWIVSCAKKESDNAMQLKQHWQNHLIRVYDLLAGQSIDDADYVSAMNQCIKEFATTATPDIIFLHNLYD